MKTIAVLGLMFVLLCSGFTGIAAADDSIDITDAVQDAMTALGVTNETPGLCVLTDAGYVKVDGETTQGCIATLRTETGCSIGAGNLLTIHRAVNKPLWFVIFDNTTKDCVYTVYKNRAFNATKVNIDGENATTGDGWNIMKDALGSDAFTIVTIANACGYGAPYDFLKCVEFHNHFCPGVTSGYMLADYLLKEYPLGADEKYVVIACPIWCKDDALQVMLDTTIGKRSIFAKNMPAHDEDAIENAAGIYIVWNGTLGSGTGHVLSFDFDEARNVSDVTEADFNTYPMASRIKMNWGMMPYLNQPETFISTLHTFDVSPYMLNRLELAGVDPYVEIGLVDDPCGINISGALQNAMATLGVARGSPGLCVLTDAGYAMVEGNTTECCIGTIERVTGCAISDGSLLPVHRSVDKPLWFAIFDNETKDCVYAVYKNGAFATTEVNIAEENVTTGDGWNATKKALGADAFTIAGVANAWGYGAPQDFLKCTELHNHLCPGLSSGYLIAGYIRENYPLGAGESYTWIGCPNWCKEDAIQVLLDLTPGKGSMIVKQRSGELFVKEKPLAGILIVWNSTAESGRGVAFQYDWGETCNLSDVSLSDFKPPGGKTNPIFWTTRMKGSFGLLPYLDQPDMFVSLASDEFSVTSEQLDRVKAAGVDPYVELGLADDTNLCAIDISGALQDAMATLGVSRDSSGHCVLTDAGYVMVDGNTTECCIGTIERDTGCSISDGNLLPVHRSVDKPLWFAIFDNETKDCVYTVYKNDAFTTTEINIAEENVTTGDGWNATKKALGADAFTIAGVANAWGYGAPNDFLKCAEFHNHICPGLTSGYMIAEYIRENYPLGAGESYTWIGCPNWCKEDAIQIHLDLTPGKRSLIVKQREILETENPLAGILIIWNGTEKSGRGVSFRYDKGESCNLTGVAIDDFSPPGGKSNPLFWTARLTNGFGLMQYLDQPEIVISTDAEFNVTSDQLDRVKMAGVDPYVELGLAEPTEVRGDFNGDGKVTSADALILLQVAAGKIAL